MCHIQTERPFFFLFFLAFAKHSLTHTTTPMTATNMGDRHLYTNLSAVLARLVVIDVTLSLSHWCTILPAKVGRRFRDSHGIQKTKQEKKIIEKKRQKQTQPPTTKEN